MNIKKGFLPQNLSFEEKIEYIRRSSIGVPQKLVIDLSVAHINLEMNIAGNFFYVMDTANINENFDVRFNEIRQPAHNLHAKQGFKTPFYKFYITNVAQAGGSATIVYGSLSTDFLDVIDNRAQSSGTLTAILLQLTGSSIPLHWGTELTVGAAAVLALAANNNRKALSLQAKSTNTGIIYIGFDNTVTTTKWFAELQAGQSLMIDDYLGATYAYGSAAGQLLGWGDW